MNFSEALELLKEEKTLYREGWSGKGIYVELIKFFSDVPIQDELGNFNMRLEPFFVLKNTRGTLNTWVPSVSDLLAEDWEALE